MPSGSGFLGQISYMEEADFVEKDPYGRYIRYDDVLGRGAFKTVCVGVPLKSSWTLKTKNQITSGGKPGDLWDFGASYRAAVSSCSLVGKQVVKVGRSSGFSTGTLLAYALEYNDDNRSTGTLSGNS